MLEIVKKAYALCDTSADELDLGECLQLSDGVTVRSTFDSPAKLINVIVQNVFVIGGVVIFALIIYAGFKFIQDDTKGKEEASKILTSAVVGAIVMFSAYWILQIMGVITGVNLSL